MSATDVETPSPSRRLRRLQRSATVADAIPWSLRLFDVLLVLLVLPFAMTLGVVIAVAVLLDSPGPVFYRSRRIGRGGRAFDMLKFRTMRHDVDGPPISARGDMRFTPLGQSLAVSRLDELPQLWNVIRGDMRLVGPRPELEYFVEHFSAEYEHILSVPPGLTGPAQLVYAGEGRLLAAVGEHERADFYRSELLPKKVAIDLAYAERHSLVRDLKILVLTALLPLHRISVDLQAGISPSSRLEPGAGRRALARAATVVGLFVAAVVLTGLLAVETSRPF